MTGGGNDFRPENSCIFPLARAQPWKPNYRLFLGVPVGRVLPKPISDADGWLGTAPYYCYFPVQTDIHSCGLEGGNHFQTSVEIRQ